MASSVRESLRTTTAPCRARPALITATVHVGAIRCPCRVRPPRLAAPPDTFLSPALRENLPRFSRLNSVWRKHHVTNTHQKPGSSRLITQEARMAVVATFRDANAAYDAATMACSKKTAMLCVSCLFAIWMTAFPATAQAKYWGVGCTNGVCVAINKKGHISYLDLNQKQNPTGSDQLSGGKPHGKVNVSCASTGASEATVRLASTTTRSGQTRAISSRLLTSSPGFWTQR